MKFLILLVAVLAVPAGCASSGSGGGPGSGSFHPESHSAHPGLVIAVFKKGVSAAGARAAVEAHSMTILREHEALREYSGRVFYLLTSDTLSSEEMVRRLEKDPRVHSVMEDSTHFPLPDPGGPGPDQRPCGF